MNRAVVGLGILVSFGTLLAACTATPTDPTLTEQRNDVSKPLPQPSPAPQLVATRKGHFSVPGKAFADGRDQEAQPPLTVMTIRVWDGVPRHRPVCQVTHADALELLTARRDDSEGRYYFLVRSKGCEGWLPETFLSPTAEAAIGDRM